MSPKLTNILEVNCLSITWGPHPLKDVSWFSSVSLNFKIEADRFGSQKVTRTLMHPWQP
jgi:hypothetical protein